MKTLKETILAILGIAFIIALAYCCGKGADAADRRERAYWTELNTHVIETWGDGREHPDHECEYDPAWCNPLYCKYLLKKRAGK